MAKILIHALAAKMAGNATYLENMLSVLSDQRFVRNEYYVYVPEERVSQFANLPEHIEVLTSKFANRSSIHRLLWDQIIFRKIAHKLNADVIWWTANFSMFSSPCPQIVNHRNPTYFNKFHLARIRENGGLKLRLIVWLKRQMSFLSTLASDVVLTPSQTMQDMIRSFHKFEKTDFRVVYHGFDREYFLKEAEKDPTELKGKLAKKTLDQRNIFYPTLFYRHKNFETLMRAIPLIKDQTSYNVRFVLNVDKERLAETDTADTLRIINEFDSWDDLILLGRVPYEYMHHIYQLSDLVVYPSYAESFGHPLIEAMYCRKPIIASKIRITQEICQESAVYFDTFDEADLAKQLCKVMNNPILQQQITKHGLKRFKDFSWEKHVETIVGLCEDLAKR